MARFFRRHRLGIQVHDLYTLMRCYISHPLYLLPGCPVLKREVEQQYCRSFAFPFAFKHMPTCFLDSPFAITNPFHQLDFLILHLIFNMVNS